MKNLTYVFILFILCSTVLGGCGAKTEGAKPAETEMTVLTIATSPGNSVSLTERVNAFNQSNEDYFVEIVEYEWEGLEGHPADSFATWLTMQILSGNGPDMVEYGGYYSPIVASERLMENLYPFMEADEDFHREDCYENILEAFEINSGLYVLPTGFRINTMCGKAGELGTERGATESWEIGEMIEAYENSANAEWLLMNNSKSLTFWELCSGCIGNYVNWETGECSFHTPEFEELLKFSDTFFDRLMISEDFSFRESLQSGQTFLQPVLLVTPWHIASGRISFGDVEMRWPGYPVADGEKEMGGGIVDVYGPALSICANSKNKEGAWEFIRSFLEPEVQREVRGIPLLKSVCEERIQEALTVEYEMIDGVKKEKVKYEMIAEGEEPIGIAAITEEDAKIFRDIVENTHRCISWDYGMGDIIREEAGIYFEKDKDAATVAEIIQNRVSVYIAERMN